MSEWVLDKRTPIALFVTLIAQFAWSVWWAAQVDIRLTNLEQITASRSAYVERLINLEQDVRTRGPDIDRRLSHIEDDVDRLQYRMQRSFTPTPSSSGDGLVGPPGGQ